MGFVTFDTYPWTKVSEGGTPLGTTPLVHISLPAGSHTLTLDNPDQGIHQTYALTVKAGESVTKHLGLK
jgi:serine/threonine-protein kinase